MKKILTFLLLFPTLAWASGTIGGGGTTESPHFTGTVQADVAVSIGATGPVVLSSDGVGGLLVGGSPIAAGSLPTVPNNTILGNNTGGTHAPVNLTVADTKTLLAYVASDIGGLDATHRWLTDSYISTWNAKQNALTAGVDYLAPNGSGANLTGVTAAQIGGLDATHRWLTDSYIATWNAKQNALVAGTDYLAPNGSGASLTGITASQVGSLDSTHRWLTDALSSTWNAKQDGSAVLTTYAGISPSANMQTFLGSANYAAMRSNMGVQAASAMLDSFAAIADPNANTLLVWDDTDNAYKAASLGSGFSYNHTLHQISTSAANPTFDLIGPGTNQNSTLTVGNGSSLVSSGSGTIYATHLGADASSAIARLSNPSFSGLTMADGTNVALSTTTGSKIGTATNQKLAFFNATPVVQQSGNLITALSNLGLVTSGSIASGDIPTLNQDTTGKAGSLKSTATTGAMSIVGPTAGLTRSKTIRDADDTLLELGGTYTPTGTWNWGTASVTWPTFNQNTTGKAAGIATARSIAGNSFDGTADVPFSNKFIVQGTSDAGLPSAQFMGSLGTGIVKNTTNTGVLSIASAGTDYAAPNQTMYLGTTQLTINRASSAQALTGINSIDGSAAKWTTARNLAGNSVDGSANVAFSNKFIVQGTSDAGLSGAQFLGALGTGLLKNTTSTGVLSVAVSGTDYAPATSGSAILKGNGTGGFSSASAGTDYVAPAGNVATATALAANGSNCSAGYAALGVDASGAAEGCWQVTPSAIGAVGLASANTFTANNTFGDADTDTLTIRSLLLGGNSRAVWIASSAPSPTYATATNSLYVAGSIETPSTVYADHFVSTGVGNSYIILGPNSGGYTPAAGEYSVYFNAGILSWAENAAEKTAAKLQDAQTFSGRKTFTGGIDSGNSATASDLRIYDGSSNYVTITAPAMSANWTMTLPPDKGTASYVLQTDGNGATSWAASSSSVAGGNTQVQYNNSGAFGASASFTYASGALQLGSNGQGGSLKLYNELGASDYTTSLVPNPSESANATITTPPSTSTLATVDLAETISATKTFSAPQSITAVNAASGSLNALTLSGTLGIFNGSDTFRGIYLNYTNANHTGTGNTVALIDVPAITGDANSNFYGLRFGNFTGTTGAAGEVEQAINVGTGFDYGLYTGSPVYIGDGTNGVTMSAAGAMSFAGTAAIGSTLPLGSNSITMTGSLAATGARVTKGWFTDIESTNAPSVNGVAANATSGLVLNPMTTAGDIILGGASGAVGRLGVGADNYVLTVSASTHLPVWAAPGGGSMVYPGAGIPQSTGSAWGTSITPGTGVVTAMGNAVNAAGGLLTSAATVGNLTGSTSAAIGIGSIELGHASDTTLSRSSAGVLAVEGVPVSLNSTSATHIAGTIELGAASDTTLARSAAGEVTIEGVKIVTESSTNTLTNKTFDAAGTGNVLKQTKQLQFTHPDRCDGTGATMDTTGTNDTFGHCSFSATAAYTANTAYYEAIVPADIDTSVDLTAEWHFSLGGADTNAHCYKIEMADVADSAARAGTYTNTVNLPKAGDASGASGDAETVSATTLTSWKSSVTAGHLLRIRVGRDGGNEGTSCASGAGSTVASYSGPLVITYGSTQ